MKIATETRLGFNEHYKVAQLPPRHSVSPNMFTKTLRGVLCLCALGTIFSAPPAVLAQSSYKICVPHNLQKACEDLMGSKSNEDVTIECVPGRDRMECLNLVNKRKADFMAVDPEDMYVAYKMNNQDFAVFSEIRTLEEPQAEFRYEGIMLVRKGSPIASLNDLQGKKSCHTGYGRTVGYKVPITKLRKHGIFKLDSDPTLPAVERELKGLSNLFSQSCLVGTYSPNDEINRSLKKKYPNLCALCEDPAKCDYPDKYSGYEGAIRCLVENGGDVAFTKVIFVNKYFGLPVGNNPAAPATGTANPDDYEYLCEDGSRRPVTGRACSWAQRPWQGYMANGDLRGRYAKLQEVLKEAYEAGKTYSNTDLAKRMLVKKDNVVVSKDDPVLPGEHLTRAQYKDVIARPGPYEHTTRFCVSDTIALRKCEVMRKAAFSRYIRPQFQCLLKSVEECAEAVQKDEADVVVFRSEEYEIARKHNLGAVLYESSEANDVFVAVVNKDIKMDLLKKATLNFNSNDPRAVNAALFFNEKRGIKSCPGDISSTDNGLVKIVKAKDLKDDGDQELICQDLSRKSLQDYKDCNFEATLPTAVFVRNALDSNILDGIIHSFSEASEDFGKNAPTEDVFELFGEFEPGFRNVIFSDDAVKLVTSSNAISTFDETHYNKLRCISE
ncbi:transferrin [Lutzomyia longipalpis]|uniref:transferrin n=1 Tax=Lutzomyia longipalpis TaxID=7200 RepID=UPI002483FE23|nr:transferrin [Lutzomyia longipalpis]